MWTRWVVVVYSGGEFSWLCCGHGYYSLIASGGWDGTGRASFVFHSRHRVNQGCVYTELDGRCAVCDCGQSVCWLYCGLFYLEEYRYHYNYIHDEGVGGIYRRLLWLTVWLDFIYRNFLILTPLRNAINLLILSMNQMSNNCKVLRKVRIKTMNPSLWVRQWTSHLTYWPLERRSLFPLICL